jgi:hypothetical protein
MEKVDEYEYTIGKSSGVLRRRIKSDSPTAKEWWLYKNGEWLERDSDFWAFGSGNQNPEFTEFKWKSQNPISEEEAFLWIINQSTNTQ